MISFLQIYVFFFSVAFLPNHLSSKMEIDLTDPPPPTIVIGYNTTPYQYFTKHKNIYFIREHTKRDIFISFMTLITFVYWIY